MRQQNPDLQFDTPGPAPSSNAAVGATPNVAATAADPTLSASAIVPGMAGMATGMVDDFGMDYGQASYDVFDPLNWMLDGIVDFPYSFSNGGSNTEIMPGMDALGNGI